MTTTQPAGQQDVRGLLGAVAALLGTGIPIFTLASGLAYVLGRIYVGRYYHEFGIPFSALSFTTTDFVFASVDLIFASVVAAILVWSGYRTGLSSDLFFGHVKSLMGRVSSSPGGVPKEERPTVRAWILAALDRIRGLLNTLQIVNAFVALVLTLAVFAVLPFTSYFPRITGLTGLVIGFAMGLIVVFLLSLIPSSWRDRRGLQVGLLVPLTVLIVAGLPFVASQLAAVEASAAMRKDNLPVAVIEPLKDRELPTAIQDGEAGVSLPLRIVVINNGSIYALVSNDLAGQKTGSRTATTIALPAANVAALHYRAKNLPSCGPRSLGSVPCGP